MVLYYKRVHFYGIFLKKNKGPIVGLGLLLDANQIPIGMKLFPGNQSEKPVIRNVIDELKTRNSVSGRTIQIADKGLNCSENIFHAVKNGDGYIFSKSVKQLPEKEKHGYSCQMIIEMLKMPRAMFCIESRNALMTMNEELIKKSLELAGYNMLVTSELSMSDKDIYEAYHNLWRIEESFRIMKSQLDARPVYLQKENTLISPEVRHLLKSLQNSQTYH